MESSTTNTSSTPKGSNSDVTANQLAMAATVLAAGAFVMAFLQALMEYIGSNEARSKCTYEAIGMTAKQVKFGWNFTFWRLRVYYPLLDFSFAAVLDQAVRQTNKDAINAPLSPMSALTRRKGQSKTFGWRAMTETENTTFNDVA